MSKKMKLEGMFDNSHNDSEKIRKLESELKAMKKLINLILQRIEEKS